MPTINTPSSAHAGPATIAGWQWLPYTDATLLHTLRDAIHIISARINGNKPCDAAFKALPSGRTFAQVWADASIWVSYDPDNIGTKYGVTDRVGGSEISITRYALRMGRWTTAATLIHELAHTNGAPGGAVRVCQFMNERGGRRPSPHTQRIPRYRYFTSPDPVGYAVFCSDVVWVVADPDAGISPYLRKRST